MQPDMNCSKATADCDCTANPNPKCSRYGGSTTTNIALVIDVKQQRASNERRRFLFLFFKPALLMIVLYARIACATLPTNPMTGHVRTIYCRIRFPQTIDNNGVLKKKIEKKGGRDRCQLE